MKTYLLVFLLAAISSVVFTPIVRRLCERLNLLDFIKDERRVHKKPVPRLGGVAIFGALVVSLGVLLFLENLPTQSLKDSWPRLLPIIIPAVLVFFCGVYDDLSGVNARFKFVVQIFGGALFYYLGGRIESLAIPFFGAVSLPPVAGVIIVVFWIVAVTNAFNLLDGLDGLAAGTALFASLVLLVVSYQMGQPYITIFALALCGALTGFLRYNFNPASIFLGDSGSLLLGFLLATLSIQGAQKASTTVALTIPIIAFGVPIFDTVFSVLRRFISGKPLFAGDKEHVHHKLLERGWSHRKVVLALYAVSALLGVCSLMFINNSPATGLFLVVVGAIVIIGMNNLRYHEVAEVRAGVRRNSLERRARVANNVRVRRAAQKMTQAKTHEAIFAALEEMLAHDQFIAAKLLIKLPHPDFAEVATSNPTTKLTRQREGWEWSWVRENAAGNPFDTAATWRLTVPVRTQGEEKGCLELYHSVNEGPFLLDINLLYKLFQRETARALARLQQTQPAASPQTALKEDALAPPVLGVYRQTAGGADSR